MAEFYLVMCKDTNGEVFSWETQQKDASHASTVKFIADGNCEFEIHRVVAIDLEAGTSRDASEEIAQHIHWLSHENAEEMTEEVVAFCERHGFDTHKDPEPHELWDDPDHYYYSGRADHERAAYRGYF
jgi:hypothetical protein